MKRNLQKLIDALVDELVEVKSGQKLLRQRENLLKAKLEPLIAHGNSISMASADIYSVDYKTKRYVCRLPLLEYLKEVYGEDIAEDVDRWCTQIRPSSRGVRVKLKTFDD